LPLGALLTVQMMDKIQRAILENQIILAEALWMLLHSQGISSEAMLENVSARIKQTRELLEEHDKGNPAQAAKEL
jgi:hypothetical protein